MSFPPPPGLKQTPSSLPPRPPAPTTTVSSGFKPAYAAPPSYSSPGTTGGYGGNAPGPGHNAFSFQPRAVAASQPSYQAPPTTTSGYQAPATSNYGNYYQQQPQTYQSGPSYYGQAQYNDATYGSYPDQANAYGKNYGRNDSGVDAETEAQIAQWQSAYVNSQEMSTAVPSKGPAPRAAQGPGAYTPSTSAPASNTPTPAPGRLQQDSKTVVRSGGGQTWTDSTLLEWDPAHFRLFVGNLAGEVTDDSLFKAFSQFSSVQKARVIRDKRTQKSKGFGFVSFSDGDDYFRAAREMQGKYIGSHPILLRRAMTEVRPVSGNAIKGGKKNHGGAGAGGSGGRPGSGKVKHDGVKKPGKTKGGLKILG
ncbi:RNP domain protein [Aspergillus ruber CBS 135680]|uniref:RNA-binding domain-containing protein n=1 Tax=Aspergillus ruber (strain CBS 135680) TaxID=1388766 RepID=A0A017SEB8_ASPRC|nr:RNA-binding domain-containing protein [Aspergillus ruber CBS 135680]EYE95106.1 RNA-binding domain-containing protein [Aspergillus ruber CBS 135680]